MIKMIGQERILNTLSSYNLKTLPKTLILIGPKGCGKRTSVLNLAERLGLELIQISEFKDDFDPEELLVSPIRKLYYIQLDGFSEKSQNKFLKFIEEPSEQMNVIIGISSEIGILPTILSRGIKLYFDEYSEDELKKIADFFVDSFDDRLFKICKTPGSFLNVDVDSIPKMFDLCNTLISKINVATYANTLSIVYKINFKEEYNKFDYELFINTLQYCSMQSYLNENNLNALKIYESLSKYISLYNKSNNAAKEPFMINFLTYLWEEVRR